MNEAMTKNEITITAYPEWWLQIIRDQFAPLAVRGWWPCWADGAGVWLLQHGLRIRPSPHTRRYNWRKEVQ